MGKPSSVRSVRRGSAGPEHVGRHRGHGLACMVVAALVLTACGGSGESATEPEPPTEAAEAGPPSEPAEAESASEDAGTEASSEAAQTEASSEDAEAAGGDAGAGDFASYIGDPDPAVCGDGEYSFGFDTFSDTDAFAVALWDGLQETAAELGCVEIEQLVDNADPSAAVQNAQVFAQQQKDGVILFNVVQAASTGQAQALEAADIPLVSLAVPVEGYPYITNDDTADGVLAGEALAAAFEESGSSGPAYAVIGRYDDQESTQARMDGVVEGLQSALPDVEILEFDTQVDGPTTQAATAALLPQIPPDATILLSAANEDLAFASFQAVRQAGREDDAIVVGIGGSSPTGLEYLCENEAWAGTIGFFPENWPDYLLPALLGLIQGADVPTHPEESIVVPTELITKENIAEFYPDFPCG